MKTTVILEKTSRQWWFYLLIISAQFIIMPLATRNFDFQQIQSIITTSLTKALIFKLTALYPYFQVTSLLFIGAFFLLKNRFGRIFSLYAALSYLAFAVIQNISVTETYGFSMVTINILMFAGVAFTWLRESLYPQLKDLLDDSAGLVRYLDASGYENTGIQFYRVGIPDKRLGLDFLYDDSGISDHSDALYAAGKPGHLPYYGFCRYFAWPL